MFAHMRLFLLLLLFGFVGISGFQVAAQEQPEPAAISTLPPYYLEHISSVAWSPDGQHIAVGHWDGSIDITDASGQRVRTLTGHTGPVSSLAWNSLGTKLVSGGLIPDPSLRIWDIATGQIIREFISVLDDVSDIDWLPNEQQVIATSVTSQSLVLDITTGNTVSILDVGAVNSISRSPDKTKIAFSNYYGGIDILDANNYTIIARLGVKTLKTTGPIPITNQIICLEWNPDGSTIAIGTWGGKVLIWDIADDQVIFEQRGNDYEGNDSYMQFVQGVHFSKDGSTLTGVGRDGTIQTWDISTEKVLARAHISDSIYAVDWSPDGSQIANGGQDKNIFIISQTDLLTPQ